jgi:hypothetical protein
MAAGSEINYITRPNKSVERKLIFEALRKILRSAAGQYDYIGFGAFWFVDFILAHRMLGITKMVSIERAHRSKRAEFNKPYRCITVIGGDSTEILPDLQFEKPVIAWLDYQAGIDGPVLEDVGILCERAASDSFIIVSLNAHKKAVTRHDADGKELPLEDTLRSVAGDLVPPALPAGSLTAANYPKLLASMIFDHLEHCCRRSGRPEDFVPVFNFTYADGAPMVTAGGVLASRDMLKTLRDLAIVDEAVPRRPEQISINVPSLTLREKTALDQILPTDKAPGRRDIEKLGFSLSEKEICAYHQYYLQYPVYGEFEAI